MVGAEGRRAGTLRASAKSSASFALKLFARLLSPMKSRSDGATFRHGTVAAMGPGPSAIRAIEFAVAAGSGKLPAVWRKQLRTFVPVIPARPDLRPGHSLAGPTADVPWPT